MKISKIRVSAPQRWIAQSLLATAMVAMVLVLTLLTGTAAHAQSGADDPPGRVGRLADLNGQVWFYSPEAGEWLDAGRNRPVTVGDRVATDNDARADVQIGSTVLRLDAGTELEVLELDDDRVMLQLHDGSVAVRIADIGEAGEFQVSTGNGLFRIQSAGSYRFDHDDHASHATVYRGLARYEGPNSGLSLSPGQRVEFWVDSAGSAQYAVNAPVDDAFARWNDDRDRRASAGASARYVSPAMTGAYELDRYGRWENNRDYGALWTPNSVASGWAPYSQGHWIWVRPWGWTWVDDAPWGFAPFHYGRWVHVHNRWAWAPGARVQRPIYAPALVGWVGGPAVNLSISIGGPAVGWFPLAPHDVYVPGYRVSPVYGRNINVGHVRDVRRITQAFDSPRAPREFENRRVPNAVTVVPAGVMIDRRPVAPAAAQTRQTRWARELATQPARAPTLIAAPLAAPSMPVRDREAAVVRAPRGSASRGSEPARPAAPGAAVPAPLARIDQAPVPSGVAGGDRVDDSRRPGASWRGQERRDPSRRSGAPVAPSVAVPAPALPVPAARAEVAPAAEPVRPQPPTMRSMPVRRAEERRVLPRATPEPGPAAEARPAPRIERVVPPQPVAQPMAPRPMVQQVPVPGAAPPVPAGPPPGVRAPRPRDEAANAPGDERRGGSRAPRESQR